jgi:hypothetical protein
VQPAAGPARFSSSPKTTVSLLLDQPASAPEPSPYSSISRCWTSPLPLLPFLEYHGQPAAGSALFRLSTPQRAQPLPHVEDMALNVKTSAELWKEMEPDFIRMQNMLDQMFAALQKRTAPPTHINEERRKAEAKARLEEDRKRRIADLEREMKAKYEAAGIEFTPFGHGVEQQHVLPQNPGETTEQPNAVPDPTVEIQEPSTAVTQLIENTQPVGLDSAQPESELIGEQQACAGITESTIDALTPTLRVIWAVDAIGADHGLPVPVRRACAGITESTIEAFPAPSQVPVPFQVRKKHDLAIEDPMGGYALPVPQLVPTNRAPPKPGEALKFLAHGSTTTSTTRTIKRKASRRDRLGRVMPSNGTDSVGGKQTVNGEG